MLSQALEERHNTAQGVNPVLCYVSPSGLWLRTESLINNHLIHFSPQFLFQRFRGERCVYAVRKHSINYML